MPVEKGSPAYVKKLKKQKGDRAKKRLNPLLKRAAVKHALKQAAKNERKYWEQQLEAAQQKIKTLAVFKMQHTKELQLRKRWETAAACHLRHFNSVRDQVVELQQENARLTKTVRWFQRQEKFWTVFWEAVRKGHPRTWQWLSVLWKQGPKPSADRGWGGGQ